MESQTSEEDQQEEESEDNYDLHQSFTDHSIKKQVTNNSNSPEIGEGELTQILQDKDKMITEDQVTSKASKEIEQSFKTKTQKESRPELRFTEETPLSKTRGS